MTGLFLLIWFYVYAGLLFAMTAYTVGLFQKFHWTAQVIFWPALLVIQAVKAIRDSNFGWFVRYQVFKFKNPRV